MNNKYKIPTMKEIEKLEWNGYNVVSTFSGGGGSCLGYEMAGYHVIWANEFIPEAQNTYRLNHKKTYLNTQDIRKITGEQILKETNLKVGEIDLFDGSPPCSAFSTAGIREDGWGKVKDYSDTVQRVDDLFFEYIRLIKELKPKVFVAENVSGLVKGTAKGYFKEILKKMRETGYEVSVRLLNAKYLGVPQSRERIIFVGVRKDLVEKYNVHPIHPKPLNKVYTVGEAIKDVRNTKEDIDEANNAVSDNTKTMKILKKIPKNPRKKINFEKYSGGGYFTYERESMFQPCSTILAKTGNFHPLYDRMFTIPELKRLTSLPDDFILTGNYLKKCERMGRMVPPIMMSKISKTIEKEILDKIKE